MQASPPQLHTAAEPACPHGLASLGLQLVRQAHMDLVAEIIWQGTSHLRCSSELQPLTVLWACAATA